MNILSEGTNMELNKQLFLLILHLKGIYLRSMSSAIYLSFSREGANVKPCLFCFKNTLNTAIEFAFFSR